MTNTVPALIWCPFPDRDCARDIVDSLLDENLVACANMIPGVASVFIWDGEREEAEETGVLLKTNSTLLESAVARLAELHPYDEPAVLGWRCDASATGTQAWLASIGT